MSATGWQPIDTAPKDGTPVDLWCKATTPGYRMTGLRWLTEGIGSAFAGGAWVDERSGVWARPVFSHWMPVPAPPDATPKHRATRRCPECGLPSLICTALVAYGKAVEAQRKGDAARAAEWVDMAENNHKEYMEHGRD